MQIPAPDAHQCVIGVAIALPSHYAAQVRAVRRSAIVFRCGSVTAGVPWPVRSASPSTRT